MKRNGKSAANALRIGVLGASGYTGAELLRLLAAHPAAEIAFLTADRQAGKNMADVFPHLAPLGLPTLTRIEDADWSTADVVFCALPHGTTQEVVSRVLGEAPQQKVIDLSADFRLYDLAVYEEWYGHAHRAPALQKEAVYGLTEFYRKEIAAARLCANPGCYTTTSELPLMPLLADKLIEPGDIIIDAKSGVSGAGRSEKQANLHTEVSEGTHAYGVGKHRHMGLLLLIMQALLGLTASAFSLSTIVWLSQLLLFAGGAMLVTCPLAGFDESCSASTATAVTPPSPLAWPV